MTTRKKRNNQYADFDERKFERGAKERAQVPIEYTGLKQRKRCPKGTRWHKETSSCQPNIPSVLGDPIGALTETIILKPKKSNLTKSKSSSRIPKMPTAKSMTPAKTKSMTSTKLLTSTSSAMPSTELLTSTSSAMPSTELLTPTSTAKKTKTLTKTKSMTSTSSRRRRSRKSAKLSKSKFMGLDNFYSSNVDLGNKIRL